MLSIEAQNHEGIDKLKLSNVIQDPSFLREVLSYEVCQEVHAQPPRANYANLYIDDSLSGDCTRM